MSMPETYKIAHTARCKLHIEADRPDRNLRFILGHAFTLDKLMLRIAEIEVDSSGSDEEEEQLPTVAGDRRVSFSGRTKSSAGGVGRNKSPPPPPQLEDSGNSDDEDDEDLEEDDEDDGLGLQRFASAAGHTRGTGGEPEPAILSDEELKSICEGESNQELADLYGHVAGCPCHGGKSVAAEKFWEVPSKVPGGPRMAVCRLLHELQALNILNRISTYEMTQGKF